jgi:hypothetical protein
MNHGYWLVCWRAPHSCRALAWSTHLHKCLPCAPPSCPQLLGPGVPGATTLPIPLHACSPPDLVAVLCCTVLPLLLPQVLYPVVYEVLGEAAQQHAEVRGVLWPWRRGLRSGEAGRSGPAPATAQHSLFWPWLWPGKFFHA